MRRSDNLPMPVRKYQERDRDQVAQLWTEVFNESAAYDQPDSMLNKKRAVDDLVFVAENDHQITGACIAGYGGHRGWLYSIALPPSQRCLLKDWPERVALW